jgi:hypothetical protein
VNVAAATEGKLSRIFKLEQWKFYSSQRVATSGKPRNVEHILRAHREIKFLIELLRCESEA